MIVEENTNSVDFTVDIETAEAIATDPGWNPRVGKQNLNDTSNGNTFLQQIIFGKDDFLFHSFQKITESYTQLYFDEIFLLFTELRDIYEFDETAYELPPKPTIENTKEKEAVGTITSTTEFPSFEFVDAKDIGPEEIDLSDSDVSISIVLDLVFHL